VKTRLFFVAVVLTAGAMAALPGCKKPEKEEAGAPAKEESPAKEKPQTRTVWTCGMPGHPEFDEASKPADGRCPQCGMKLVTKEIPVKGEN
jgi:rubrerythrin